MFHGHSKLLLNIHALQACEEHSLSRRLHDAELGWSKVGGKFMLHMVSAHKCKQGKQSKFCYQQVGSQSEG